MKRAWTGVTGAIVTAGRLAASPLRAMRVLPATAAALSAVLMLAHRVLLVRLRLEQAAFFDVGRGMDVTAAYRGEARNGAYQKQATGDALQSLAIAIHGASPF
jgi:hypothetical protein